MNQYYLLKISLLKSYDLMMIYNESRNM